MAKVGYIFEANSYDAFDADKEWMRQYGCVQVVEETVYEIMIGELED